MSTSTLWGSGGQIQCLSAVALMIKSISVSLLVLVCICVSVVSGHLAHIVSSACRLTAGCWMLDADACGHASWPFVCGRGRRRPMAVNPEDVLPFIRLLKFVCQFYSRRKFVFRRLISQQNSGHIYAPPWNMQSIKHHKSIGFNSITEPPPSRQRIMHYAYAAWRPVKNMKIVKNLKVTVWNPFHIFALVLSFCCCYLCLEPKKCEY